MKWCHRQAEMFSGCCHLASLTTYVKVFHWSRRLWHENSLWLSGEARVRLNLRVGSVCRASGRLRPAGCFGLVGGPERSFSCWTPRGAATMNFYGRGFQERRFNHLKTSQQRRSEVLSTASKTALQSHFSTLWKSCINLSWHSNYSKLERLPEYLRPDGLKQVQNWTDELSAWANSPERMITQTS